MKQTDATQIAKIIILDEKGSMHSLEKASIGCPLGSMHQDAYRGIF